MKFTALAAIAAFLATSSVYADVSLDDIMRSGVPGFFNGGIPAEKGFSARSAMDGGASHRFTSRTIEGRFVVTIPSDVAAGARQKLSELLASDKSSHISHDWEHVGVAGSFSEQLLEQLRAHFPSISVEQDQEFSLAGAYAGPVNNPASYGLDRIDQPNLPLSTTFDTKGLDGSGVYAYVVDTGIYYTVDQYEGRVTGGTPALNFNANDKARGLNRDCNGHGTHVAGTVLSKTYGIAKNAMLTAIKVLSCQGSGATADIVAGLNSILAMHPKGKPGVVNMSLGGPGASPAMEAAIRNLVANNIVVVVAAGNENQNACNVSPAREPVAITVAATDRTDAKASYSNFGTCVDIHAPGSLITSTFASATSNSSTAITNTISGTSMAAPHVAGVVALILQQNPALTPAQVLAELLRVAVPGKVTGNVQGTPNILLQIPTYATPPVLKPTDTVLNPSMPLPPNLNVVTPKAPSGVFTFYNATADVFVLTWQADFNSSTQCLVLTIGAQRASDCFSSNICNRVTNSTSGAKVLFCSLAIRPRVGTYSLYAYSSIMDVNSPNGNAYTYIFGLKSVTLNGVETVTLLKPQQPGAGGNTGNQGTDGTDAPIGDNPTDDGGVTPTPGDDPALNNGNGTTGGQNAGGSDASTVAKFGVALGATVMATMWALV